MAETKLKNQAFTSVDLDAWTAFTPSWTNFTIGNGTTNGYYCQVGKKVTVQVSLILGSTSSMSNYFYFTLPVTAKAFTGTLLPIGTAILRDTGAAFYFGTVCQSGTTLGKIYPINAASTYLLLNDPATTVPFTWANTDEVVLTCTYEAA